jgi:predicted phage tail protein
MIKVYLAGILGAEYGRKHVFNIRTTREIISALSANFTNFKSRIMELSRQGYVYTVQHGAKLLGKDELNHALNDFVVITPRLVVNFDEVFQFLAGIVLVGIGLFISPFAPTIGMALIGAGVSMIIGGVLALLAPGMKQPKLDDQGTVDEAVSSFYAGGDFRMISGSPMPFGYGTMLVTGSILSTVISTVPV